MKTLIIIPSRLSATRLPGKPLLKLNGQSIISHVFKRAESAKIGEVVVATEDQEIVNDVQNNGGATLTGTTSITGATSINTNAGANTTSIGTGTTTGAIAVGSANNTSITIDGTNLDIPNIQTGTGSAFLKVDVSGNITQETAPTLPNPTVTNNLTVQGSTTLGNLGHRY